MHQNDIQLNQGKDTIEKANFLVFIKLFLLWVSWHKINNKIYNLFL